MHFSYTRLPGDSYPRRFRFLWLWSCDVFGALINSLYLMNQRRNKRINRLKLWLIVIKIFQPTPTHSSSPPSSQTHPDTPPFVPILSVRHSLTDHFDHSVCFPAAWAGGRPFPRCCPCPMTPSGWKPNPNWIHFPCRFHPVTKGGGGGGAVRGEGERVGGRGGRSVPKIIIFPMK